MKTSLRAPLYSQIQKYILDKIQSKEWPPDCQIPSERELGEQFGVSRITAKNAVLGLVQEGFLYRHRGKGTFVADKEDAPPAGAFEEVRRPPQKIIGFLYHWMELHYGSLLFAGLEAELTERGYHVIYKRVTAAEKESEAIRDLMEIPVSGLILLANSAEHFNDDIIRLILDKYPLVLIEKTTRDLKTNSVYCDTEAAGALMAEYLLSKGIRDIGLLTYPETFTHGVKERIFGFQAGLVNNGHRPLTDKRILTLVSKDVVHDGPLDTQRGVPAEIVDFIDRNPEMKAVATVDALLARYVSRACAQAGRRDMVIVCCDEPSGYYGGVSPSAYIDQSPAEMGRLAVRLLTDSLGGETEPQTIVIRPRLVEF